jgi:hypothetical protein
MDFLRLPQPAASMCVVSENVPSLLSRYDVLGMDQEEFQPPWNISVRHRRSGETVASFQLYAMHFPDLAGSGIRYCPGRDEDWPRAITTYAFRDRTGEVQEPASSIMAKLGHDPLVLTWSRLASRPVP